MTRLLLAIALCTVACGEDTPPPPAKAAPGAPGAPGGPADDKNKLTPRRHVEESVVCPVPEKPTGLACKPDTATCDPGKFCIQVNAGWSCEPCPERDSIRHEFRDRDFVADQVRDPFQSYIIVPKGLEPSANKHPEAGPCNRADQFVASNYSYLELRLVGIVTRGTQRKALMMGGNVGYFLRRGDCVGKEKAVVKDIGSGYVTFVVQPDTDERNGNRAPEERSLQLHPTSLQVTPQPTIEPGAAPTAPVVTPGSAAPTAPVVQPPTR